MDTLTTCITRAKEFVPDITTTHATVLGNQIIAEAAVKWPLLYTSADISLTADTREYTLPDTYTSISSVYYLTSATSGWELTPIDLMELENLRASWRLTSSGTPEFWYEWSNATVPVIGLYPTPNTTTSSGYPIIRVWYSTPPSTLVGATAIPSGLGAHGTQYVALGIALKYAKENIPDMVDYYQALFDVEEQNVDRYRSRRSALVRPRLFPYAEATEVI